MKRIIKLAAICLVGGLLARPVPVQAAGLPSSSPVWAGLSSYMPDLQVTFGSRQRMIQLATIGMCFALWIMLRNKH